MTISARAKVLISFETHMNELRLIAFERDDDTSAWQVIDIVVVDPQNIETLLLEKFFGKCMHLARIGELYEGDGRIWVRQLDGTHRPLTPNEEFHDDVEIPLEGTDDVVVLHEEEAQTFDRLRTLIREASGG